MEGRRVAFSGLVWGWVLAAAGAAAVAQSGVPADRFAPGEIVMLRLTDIQTRFSEPVRATATPLPAELGGISIVLRQLGGPERPLPLLAIEQDGAVTRVLAQVPFELFIPPPGSLAPVGPSLLIPQEGGAPRDPVRFMAAADNLRVVAITHADGALATPASPARAGEVLVVYLLGMGHTAPRVASGVPSPSPPAVVAPPQAMFDFGSSSAPATPSFAGLSPGSVGLYQVNVTVPQPPENLAPCVPEANATLRLAGRASEAAAAVCIDPLIRRQLE